MQIRSLQAAQAGLARHKASDTLKKHLERRPDREELIESESTPFSSILKYLFDFCPYFSSRKDSLLKAL